MFSRWEQTITDELGNRVDQPTVRVQLEIAGAPNAVLKADKDGVTPLSNPFTPATDVDPFFYVAGGFYKITITKGAYTKVLRDVALGTAAGSDSPPFIPAGDWDSVTEYVANNIVRHVGAAYFALQASIDVEPGVDVGWADYWFLLAEDGVDGTNGTDGADGADGADGTVLPAIAPGDAGKALIVNETEDGYEYGTVAGGGGGGSISPPQGRLTLTSGVAVTTSDVTGATTIYYTPAGGQNVPVYDGSAWSMHDIGSELSLALDSNSGHTNYHQADKNFDLFYAVVSGMYYFGTGPKWDNGAVAGSNTARGTGAASTELELYGGFFVNKNSMTLRHGSGSGDTVTVPARQATFLGSFRAVANGQVTDSKLQRFLSNIYNQAHRVLNRYDSTMSWTYSTDAWRQARASTSNKVEVLSALGADMVNLTVVAIANVVGLPSAKVGLGIDSTSANSASVTGIIGGNTSGLTIGVPAQYAGYLGLGYHYAAWLERGSGSGTNTWYGDSGSDAFRSGIIGWALG